MASSDESQPCTRCVTCGHAKRSVLWGVTSCMYLPPEYLDIPAIQDRLSELPKRLPMQDSAYNQEWPACCEKDYSNYNLLYGPDRCIYDGCTGSVVQFALFETVSNANKVLRHCGTHSLRPETAPPQIRIVTADDIQHMQYAGAPGEAIAQAKQTGFLKVKHSSSPLIGFWKAICGDHKKPFVVHTPGRIEFDHGCTDLANNQKHALSLLTKLGDELKKLDVKMTTPFQAPARIDLPDAKVDEVLKLVTDTLQVITDPQLFAVSYVLDT